MGRRCVEGSGAPSKPRFIESGLIYTLLVRYVPVRNKVQKCQKPVKEDPLKHNDAFISEDLYDNRGVPVQLCDARFVSTALV